MLNKVGRDIPDSLSIVQKQGVFQGAFAAKVSGRGIGMPLRFTKPGTNKVLKSLEDAIDATELKDGMTISFHHSLRNGDSVMELVVSAIAKKGIKDLRISASSLPVISNFLAPYIESGVITRIDTSGAREKVGKLIQSNILAEPAVFRTHGGRARAIATGTLEIDVAFIAAPACDKYGNITGTQGPSACGALGYAMMDARYANQVVAVTDFLSETPLNRISIPQTQVDYIVQVDCIGDPAGIATGSLKPKKSPADLAISQKITEVIAKSGYLKDGVSIQIGSGGIAINTAKQIGNLLRENNIKVGSAVGGVTGVLAEYLNEGLINCFYDPQDFDQKAVENLAKNPYQIEVSAGDYANPFSAGPYVNQLDVVLLSATEIDFDFNVNVLTDSYGILRGAPGGHPDAAAGAKMTIITLPLLRGRLPMVMEKVTTVVTPGETVDVVVTDYGMAVNPLRQDLIEQFKTSGIKMSTIEELHEKAIGFVGKPQETKLSGIPCGVVEYRDGTIIDIIHKI